MRTALFSDIHGNYEGLLRVLADIEQQRCDRILCLGDLVDAGPQSVEVVNLFRERGLTAVQGNHDEFPIDPLPRDIADYLQTLPKSITEGPAHYTHTSPRKKMLKITSGIEAWNVFEETQYRRIFVGDIHIPLIFGARCSEKVSATSYDIPYDEEFQFEQNDRYIICVGAIGYSRDAYNWMRYAIFDSDKDTILFRAPEGPMLKF